jgi:uracil-DNA glycosylase
MIQTSSLVTFSEKSYSWEDMTLQDYIQEGNTPINWENFFSNNEEHLHKISTSLSKENPKKIYPAPNKIFRAFIPLSKIKVVVLGQDPYHNGSAVGYCFSVLPGNKINPSLRNIYKELKQEGFDVKEDGILTHWAEQGCFMLNTALTVEKSYPDSHTVYWYDFTENAIKHIASECKNVVWLLMGSKAHKFQEFIPPSHLTLCTSHPSPFSAHKSYRGIPSFLGSGIFNTMNIYLEEHGIKPIKF